MSLLSLIHPPCGSFAISCLALFCFAYAFSLLGKSEWIEPATRALLWVTLIASTCAFFAGYGAESFVLDASPELEEPIRAHHICAKILLALAFLIVAVWEASRACGHRKTFLKVASSVLLVGTLGLSLYVGHTGNSISKKNTQVPKSQ